MPKPSTFVHKLYDGQVELVFYPSSHRYKVGGDWVPSVTGITDVLDKPALVGWAARMCSAYLLEYMPTDKVLGKPELVLFSERMQREFRRVSQEAADIGTQVHDFAEKYARWKLGTGPEPKRPGKDADPRLARGVDAFLQWTSEHKVRFIHAERKVFSRQYGYAGTLDLFAEIDGVRTLTDYKSSKAWYAEYSLQVAGYRQAFEEEFPGSVESSLGLRFDKETGEPERIPIETHGADLEAFMACLAIKRWKRSA